MYNKTAQLVAAEQRLEQALNMSLENLTVCKQGTKEPATNHDVLLELDTALLAGP